MAIIKQHVENILGGCLFFVELFCELEILHEQV